MKEFTFSAGTGYLVFETGTTPKLEKLWMPLSVSMAKGHGFIIGLGHLPCLKYAEIILCDEGATSYESKAAAAAIRNEANANPNRPRVNIRGEWIGEDKSEADVAVVQEPSGAHED